ncbi:hypothetical protein GOV10_01225 [Candidatus Woesearchaeota archaeon]|nr:hypothetical protein [Candidatus Woesearchaeota archaeon]
MSGNIEAKSKLPIGLTLTAVWLLLMAITSIGIGGFKYLSGYSESLTILVWSLINGLLALIAWWGVVSLRRWAYAAFLLWGLYYAGSEWAGILNEDESLVVNSPVIVQLIEIALIVIIARYIYKRVESAPNHSTKCAPSGLGPR